uniref:Uncharacterized protein n=1 Tax=Tanacetum cinerariifolium TaxID=118510 RepID=A0A699KJS7_TANCI|nr:hypothetical protein [Tanacetum cinerariifolium]
MLMYKWKKNQVIEFFSWDHARVERLLISLNINDFMMYCSITGTEALNPLKSGYPVVLTMLGTLRSSYARAMIELRADVELKDNIVAVMRKITGEEYYTCNIHVDWPEYDIQAKTSLPPVFKKPTANTSVNKKKNVEPTKEASQATNSSGSSFWNVDASSPSTTLVIEKIDKIKKLIIEGKVTLMDDDGQPLEKVASSYDYDSEDESLLEQWTESYKNGDYGYDSYDDDMYEGQDIPEKF